MIPVFGFISSAGLAVLEKNGAFGALAVERAGCGNANVRAQEASHQLADVV